MRSLLSAFTTRGASFIAAGIAAGVAGLILGERDLISVGALLVVLPLFSALAAGRARYRLSCQRSVVPPRIPAGQAARVTLRLENVSRLPAGLLLAEDTVPYTLGNRPRYVLNGLERGGVRELTYPLRSDVRGRFTIGPLDIRIADTFGLVELGRSFSSRSTFVVTPKVVPLPHAVVAGSWVGDGDGRTRATLAAGEDDVIPRAYRDGDELRRVHWRSTARYGELMVRREEQRWRNRVLLLLDTRRHAHSGSGPASSFEFAVSAAASIGVHMAHQGLDGQLFTDTGAVTTAGMFEDVLLDTLAVIRPSRSRDLGRATSALRYGSSGLIIALVGRLSADAATQLAACRRDGGPAIALLLAVSTWGSQALADTATGAGISVPNGHDGAGPAGDGASRSRASRGDAAETAGAAAVLMAAGWRVVSVDAGMPLAVAWQQLAMYSAAALGQPERRGAPGVAR
jgi:uncharacterized protein (DUF58 family)